MVMKKAFGRDSPLWEELLDPPDLASTMAAACIRFRGKWIGV
jgi:hypothetical protein